jgi:LPXTG-site transpeptidase (sortase) family protein
MVVRMNDRPRRRPSTFLSNLFIGLGVAVLLLATAGYGYNYWQEQQLRADPWLARLEATYARAAGSRQHTPTAADTATAASAAPDSTATVASAPTSPAQPPATTTATPVVNYPAPVGLSIPRVDIQSQVVSVGVKNGEYEVPKFYVGHYTNTANPGQTGNGVYIGHIESLSSGNVFANLPKVKVGDQVKVYTPERVWDYRVTEVLVVANNDLSVMNPSQDQRLTLITCTGDWDVLSRQYTDRLVVVAQPVD